VVFSLLFCRARAPASSLSSPLLRAHAPAALSVSHRLAFGGEAGRREAEEFARPQASEPLVGVMTHNDGNHFDIGKRSDRTDCTVDGRNAERPSKRVSLFYVNDINRVPGRTRGIPCVYPSP